MFAYYIVVYIIRYSYRIFEYNIINERHLFFFFAYKLLLQLYKSM